MFGISKDFEGGNIIVVCKDEYKALLRQEIRDTTEWWFYWAFCAEDLPDKEVTFRFDDGEVVGKFGPSVSYDGINWQWLGSDSAPDRKAFVYTNTTGHKKVWFAFSHLYSFGHLYDFLAKHKNNKALTRTTLTLSEKLGLPIPLLRIGSPDAGQYVILTARHHACETGGSYVLEGFLEQLLSSSGYIAKECCVYAVPIVDTDGVVAGDQGKSRYPYDHNRDYGQAESIYAAPRAIKELLAHNCEGRVLAAIDFHCPYKWAGENDTAFWARRETAPDGAKRFSDIMRKRYGSEGIVGAIPYTGKTDMMPGDSWNTNGDKSFAGYMSHIKGVPLALTIETPYFGTPNTFVVTPDSLRDLGRRYALALDDYLSERVQRSRV